jgi:fibronectin type 3 domain-containing protein
MKPIKSPSLFGWSIALMSVLSAVSARGQTPAFPGAQGFGANVTGGRSGSVYHVTTLADSGAGSFRDAVSVANRIVVFDVGGYITLSSEVAIKANITIAGQTAPGGGIGIRGAEVSFGSQNNIIVRHVRFRPGSASGSSDNGLNFYQAHGVILDHVSIEFAKWNNIDAATGNWQTFPIADITVQNSIIADPIGQQFGAHTEAPSGTWSWFNNIFANSHNRNPLAKVNTVFINNVLYNCDAGYTTHTSTSFSHDIVNNYFVAGPASGGNFPWFQIDNNQSMYFTGNLRDGSLDGVLNGSSTVPLPGYQGGGTILSSPWSAVTTSYPTVSSASAFRRTLSQSGALPRDQMDALVLSQVQTIGSGTTGTGAGTRGPDGALYTSETQTGLANGGFGTINGGTVPTDTDNDGMPDFWERALGWNPNSADSMVIVNGYARLEGYVNWLADPHVSGNANATIDLNLTQYTSGFVNSPVFSVASAVNGSVALLADGHTARFTPTPGFFGLGRYNFTVTDSAGSTMTLAVGVLVQPAPPPAPTGLSAVPGNAQVTVNWGASAGATGYIVYRATNTSGPFSAIASVSSTSFTNTGLINGTTYFYSVSATNAFGQSALSAYIGATPQAGTPAAPTGLTATPGNARVTLNWNTSSGATSYRVKRATVSGGPYSNIATNTTTTYTNTGLANGTTYFFVVSAANASGESANSSQVSATPSAGSTGVTNTIQAEAGTIGGGVTIDSNNAGFNGTGFANFPTTGGFLQFSNVNGGSGGAGTVTIRYALGITTSRTGQLLVNGVTQSITFTPSGSWTTWTNKVVNITLGSGTTNVIRFQSNGQDLANIDEITVAKP